MIIFKSEREIAHMREAGKVVALALDAVGRAIEVGITTAELDEIARKVIFDCDAIPSFKGYNGFPANICTSVNSEVVHGIPSSRILKDGDIISVDCGAFLNGYHGDSARTYPVGNISEATNKLVTVTKESLFKGIEQAVVGNRLGAISSAVQVYAEANGFGVVRDYVGHGIGRNMHEEPTIPNYGKISQGPKLMAGMVLAIEPMINMGSYKVKTLQDGWTAVTVDGKYSAHFEHTVAITENGPEILTIINENNVAV